MASIPDRIRALLEETIPFAWLAPEQWEGLLGDLTVEFFEPGEIILEQFGTGTKGLYLVESGLVRLMDVDQRRLLEKCVRGDTFGSYGLLRTGPRIYEARALENTVCAVLEAKRFRQLCEQYPDIRAFFERDINQYIRSLDSTRDVTGAHLLFDQPLAQFALRPTVSVPATTTAQEAARRLSQSGSDTLLVTRHGKLAGVLTDRDLRDRLLAAGKPYDTAVSRLMTAPPVTISDESTLFDAMMRMLKSRVDRLVVVREGEDVPIGLISDRDLMHFRGLDPVATVRLMDEIQSTDALTDVRSEINDQLLRLYQQRVSPELLGRISAVIYDRIVVRVLELVEGELKRSKHHTRLKIDLKWAWIRLGSGGRQEMALNSAQHNALVYEDASSEEEAKAAAEWFPMLAERANAALERCGFEAGTAVARDPEWCLPVSAWMSRTRRWIRGVDPVLPPEAPLTFDFRCVYGERELVAALRNDILESLTLESSAPQFLKMIAAEVLGQVSTPSLFRRFVLDLFKNQRHRFNIKERGIMPVIGMARVLALDIRYLASSNTFDRLRRVGEEVPELAERASALLDAYQYLVDFRLEHQLRAVEAGEEPGDELDLSALSQNQRDLLYSALNKLGELHDVLGRRYGV